MKRGEMVVPALVMTGFLFYAVYLSYVVGDTLAHWIGSAVIVVYGTFALFFWIETIHSWCAKRRAERNTRDVS